MNEDARDSVHKHFSVELEELVEREIDPAMV
jgi:hypothetical protein